ncbi:MAG: D-alanine--D-alanine ligase [bacterium]|nr:D-alanine--D-alanine ligase [bacterium]
MKKKSNKKIRLAVIMGSASSEHEVSLATGREVLKNLDRKKYIPRSIVISKKNRWFIGKAWFSPSKALRGVDVVFNAMHGEYGEDGRAQKLFEFYGVPYTGSGVEASVLGMNKFASRKIFAARGLITPKTLCFTKKEYLAGKKVVKAKILKTYKNGLCVIKPVSCGSSVGVSVVNNPQKIEAGLRLAFALDSGVLVEEYLNGRELTVPVLEKKRGKPKALPVIEIRPRKGNFFDYKEKYSAGGAEEIVPARLSKGEREKVVMAALVAHKALECRGYSRADFILVKGVPYILEINTLPGLTSNSLFPKSAKKAGIAFSKLLDILVASAL